MLVDPRCSETADKALDYGGHWLPIRPGTDGALALALANVIIAERLYDANFVANWTVGFHRVFGLCGDQDAGVGRAHHRHSGDDDPAGGARTGDDQAGGGRRPGRAPATT